MPLFVIVFTQFQVFINYFFFFPSSDLSQKDKSKEDVEDMEPYITAYLHSHERPNEFNYTDKKRITLSMTRGQDLDHRKYTFFLSPE